MVVKEEKKIENEEDIEEFFKKLSSLKLQNDNCFNSFKSDNLSIFCL